MGMFVPPAFAQITIACNSGTGARAPGVPMPKQVERDDIRETLHV